ncbi:ATP-binding protein [Streptomyces sp. NPDC020983]|uniref:ATP-binding protein n=1 Tax=Streptomyces sp. NPDC020983 TaxID=3365106 RepID=UPI0037ABD77A
MPQRHTRLRPALLERDAHLLAVEEALDELTGRRADGAGYEDAALTGGLLAFSGPAGLGKTALLAEVRRQAAGRGCTVLSARGGEHQQHVAFHVARQLLQPQFAAAGEAEARAALGSWYGVVGPALGLCTAEGDASDAQALRDGLDWVLTHLAVKRAPVVLVLDDAHWADPQSLNWLAAFAPRTDDLALLVVIGYRPDELPPDAEAFRGLPGRSGHRPIGLPPLTEAAVARVVRDAVGAHADDAFCRECFEVTSGNPFEAVELAAKVAEQGLAPDATALHQLRDLAAAVKGPGLARRLDRLGPSTVRFAWAAAVLGTAGTPELAADVAGLGHEEAVDCAERLRSARILAGGETLDFAHPLIATAVYRAIPDTVRTGLHAQAAWSVVDAGLGPSAAARHLLETRPAGDPWVVAQLRAAARDTLRAGAREAARSYLRRALREPPQEDDRAAVLYELACASQLLEPSVTVGHLKAALEEPTGDPALRDGIVFRLSQSLAHSDQLGEAAEIVARAARSATTSRGRLRMQAEQFMWDAFRTDEPDSQGRSKRLALLADRLTGRDATERYIIGLRAWDATLRGEPVGEALRHSERALAGGMPWADETRGFEVPVLVAMTYAYADRPERTEELFATGIAAFERFGFHGAHLAFGQVLLGHVRYRQGLLADAEQAARGGLRLAERVGRGTPVHWYAVAGLVAVLLARGKVADAAEVAGDHDFHAPFPSAVTFPDAQAVHGELLLAQGLHAEAAAALTEAGGRLDRRGWRNPAWCPWQIHLALAQRHVAPDSALTTALDAVSRARHYGAGAAIGQALRAAGLVSTGAERLRLLEEAVACLDASPAVHDLAGALVDHGSALRAAGSDEEAAERLRAGLAAAERCAADGTAERARAELAAITAAQGAAG